MASLSASASISSDEFDTTFTFSSKVPTGVRIDSITLKQTTTVAGSTKGTWTLRTGNATGTTIGTISSKSITDLQTTTTFTNNSYNTIQGLTTTYLHTTATGTRLKTTYTLTVNYTVNSTYWSSTSTLSLSRSGTSVTATKGGTAVNSWGSAVTYYLYEGSTNKGTFSGDTLTLSNVSVGEHTYKVVASAGGLTADGASKSVTVPAAAITWSNATLTLAQNDTTVTATKGGTATHNYGTAVTYYLYEGSTKIGTFSGNTLSFTPSVGTHTYKTVASGGGISKDGASASITVVEPHKTLKIYNSSGWVECIIYRYNGSSFIEVEPYYYNGTSWSACSHT